VQEILHTQVSGDTGSFIVTCTVGAGRVVAISDSAPADDGTTSTSGKALHNSYTLNSNRAFFLNATTYLAGATSAPVPVVGIVSPASNPTITAGGAVTFQGSASISDGSTLSYGWAFGDGGTAAALGPVSHAYPTAGTYTATFTATSNQGQAASATRTITVNAASFTLTASAGTGGAISPAGAVSVANGGSQTFTISPAAGYVISSVTVDGVNQGALGTYTFSNVTANHTIAAAFTASAGSSLTESFNTGTKGAYAIGTVALATGTWTLDDALLGNTSSDHGLHLPHRGQDRLPQARQVRHRRQFHLGPLVLHQRRRHLDPSRQHRDHLLHHARHRHLHRQCGRRHPVRGPQDRR
jgi:PKD repeat protein